jgi:hypothetical protein
MFFLFAPMVTFVHGICMLGQGDFGRCQALLEIAQARVYSGLRSRHCYEIKWRGGYGSDEPIE